MAENDVELIDPTYEGPFSDITMARDLHEFGGGGQEWIGASAARSALTKRVFEQMRDTGVLGDGHSGPGWSNMQQEARHFATEVVRWLPREALYGDVLANLDLRPLIVRWGETYGDGSTGKTFADLALQAEVIDLENAYADADKSNSTLTGMTDEQIAAAVERAKDFSSREAGRRPSTAIRDNDQQLDQLVAAGQMTPEQANQQLLDDPLIGDLDDPGTMVKFPANWIENAVYTGEITNILDVAAADEEWMRARDAEGAPYDAATSFTPINLGPEGIAPSSVPGEFRPSDKPVILNAIDAINALRDMTPSKIASLQRSLARAGYMENNQGLTYEEGDAFDPLTRDAWKLALLDSVMRGGMPLPQLLIEKGQEAEKRRQEMTRIQNEDVLRSSVNGMALESIGRELTDDEFDRLRGFIKHIGGQRADDMAEGRMPTVETYDGQLYGESDVMAKFDEITLAERAASSGFDSAQAVWKGYGMDPLSPEEIAAWRKANRPKWMRKEEDYR